MAYSGWQLSEAERAKALALIPATYPDVIAHHITSELGAFDTLELPPEVSAEIIGFVDDGEGVHALVVLINGSTARPGGGKYHITWSLDRSKGFKPVDSNKVISQMKVIPFAVTLPIKVEPRIFR
jgi:hypothetical protein